VPRWDSVLDAAQAGSDTALAKFVSAVENDDWGALSELGRRISATDPDVVSTRIGITGAAGAGKSTLVSALASTWPGNTRVGAVAVDPSSELTGGALLGDRYRLYDHDREPGHSDQARRLYLRSVAARGSQGAMSRHLGAIVSAFENIALDPVIVETAGAGQGDIGVREIVDCLVLVLNPDSGDVIQMLKAGLMEWADLFVVNKSDRPGAREFAAQLRGVVARQGARHGVPPGRRVHSVQARDPDTPEMRGLVQALRDWPVQTAMTRQESWTRTVERLVLQALVDNVTKSARAQPDWLSAIEACAAGKQDPDGVVGEVLARITEERGSQE
jgi:LAO/AO transport system kinase